MRDILPMLKECKAPSSLSSPSFLFWAIAAHRPRRLNASPAHRRSTRNSDLGSDEAQVALRMRSIRYKRSRGQVGNGSQIALGSLREEEVGYWQVVPFQH